MAGLMDFLSGSGGDPTQGGGLMSMYANPQMAGLLGMSQGLLQASGPSRIPVTMGQAMGNGMQGMEGGFNNALQMQRGLYQMRMLQGLMGGGQDASGQQSAPQSASAPMPAVTGPANAGPMSGLSAGLGGAAQSPAAASDAAVSAYPGGAAYTGPLIQGMTPAQALNKGIGLNMMSPGSGTPLISAALSFSTPTDSQKDVGAAYGYGTPGAQDALRAIVNKSGTVTGRAGGYLQGPNGTMWLPNVPQGGMPVMANGVPTGAVTAQPGATDIAAAMAAARTGGEGSQLPFTSGVDAQGNPLPIMSRTQAATGNRGSGAAPTLTGIFTQQESSGGATAAGNPLQIQQGTFNQYAQPGESWANPADRSIVAQRVLTGYNQKYGGDLGRIATAYFSGEGNVAPAGSPTPFIKNTADANGKTVASYVGDILGRSGGAGFGGSAPAAGGAQIYAAPPMGATTAANASQGAPSKQMADAYGALSSADANYQQSREALTNMLQLAGNKGPGGAVIGVLPEAVGTKISPDAAEYQKLHATYVALQGKALGSGGTDAARATIDEAVPTYDKPQSAMVSGLNTQLNNLDLSHIKTQFLTPIYQQGNEKTYTQQSAAFDQNIKPSMIPVLTQSGDAQRAAVQAAVKANPTLRSNFEWAFNNGLLK